MRYRHNLKVDHDEGRSVALVRRTSLAVDGRESSIQWRSGNDAATTIECAIPRLTLRVSESLLDLTFRSPQVVAAAADRHIGFVMTHTDERSLERWRLAVENSQHECFSRTLFKAKTTSSTIRCISMLFMALTPVWQKRQGYQRLRRWPHRYQYAFQDAYPERREQRRFRISVVAHHLQWQPPLYRHA